MKIQVNTPWGAIVFGLAAATALGMVALGESQLAREVIIFMVGQLVSAPFRRQDVQEESEAE